MIGLIFTYQNVKWCQMISNFLISFFLSFDIKLISFDIIWYQNDGHIKIYQKRYHMIVIIWYHFDIKWCHLISYDIIWYQMIGVTNYLAGTVLMNLLQAESIGLVIMSSIVFIFFIFFIAIQFQEWNNLLLINLT